MSELQLGLLHPHDLNPDLTWLLSRPPPRGAHTKEACWEAAGLPDHNFLHRRSSCAHKVFMVTDQTGAWSHRVGCCLTLTPSPLCLINYCSTLVLFRIWNKS